MDAFYTFAVAHPVLTAWLALLALWAWCKPFDAAFRCWNRRMRSRNIVARGWPPAHCDADGDPVTSDADA